MDIVIYAVLFLLAWLLVSAVGIRLLRGGQEKRKRTQPTWQGDPALTPETNRPARIEYTENELQQMIAFRLANLESLLSHQVKLQRNTTLLLLVIWLSLGGATATLAGAFN